MIRKAGADARAEKDRTRPTTPRTRALVGPDGLLAGITKTVLQAALEAEMTDHLGL